MVDEGNNLKQHKHTIIFSLYTILICIPLWLIIWIISNWLIRSYYPDLISNMFYIIVTLFDLMTSFFIIWIVRQSYLQFRDKHAEHTKLLNETITEFVEKCDLAYSGHEIHFSYSRESNHEYPELYRFDINDNKYWVDVVKHLHTGKTYKNTYIIYTDLLSGIKNYDKSASVTINIIEKKVINELQQKFPDFTYKLTGGNCILKDTIVKYIWNKYWNRPNQDSKSNPIDFRVEKIQLGKPGIHFKTKISIGANLLATYSLELEIIDELKGLVEKLVSNQEFKQLLLNISEIGNNTNEIFKKFKKELDNHTKIIESNLDIDGKCGICPNMFF